MQIRHLGFIFVCSLLISCALKSPLVVDRSSPEKAFETWKQAILRMDTTVLIDSYVVEAREGIRRELSETTRDGIEAMRLETSRTKFEIEKIVYQQNKAFVRVRRDLAGDSEIELVTMIQEDGQWRLLP
jgi:sugar-specific transcriptional regulator TrmB